MTAEQPVTWWNLDLKDHELLGLTEAFRSKKLSYNSVGAELEKKICETLGCKYAVLTTSGSTALLVALKALGLKSGDEVIVPNRTFQATANAVHFLQCKVRLADVDENGLMDPDEVERLLTPQTRAVIPVHLNGRTANIKRLKSICEKHRIALLEDAAQAFMSSHEGKFLGTYGDAGCFSFGVTKYFTSGQGGAVVTDSEKVYLETRKYIFHAMSGTDSFAFPEFGFNFRLSDLLSSVALAQLNRHESKTKRFLDVYKFYSEALLGMKSVSLWEVDIAKGELPIWIEILSPKRDALFSFLKERGLQTMKFYPSLHRSEYLAQDHSAFKNSAKFESHGLILPCGPDITDAAKKRVVSGLTDFERLYGQR